MSLGQLDEGDYDVHIEHEVLNIWDAKGRLLAQVQCLANHLYLLHTTIAHPLYLSMHHDDG